MSFESLPPEVLDQVLGHLAPRALPAHRERLRRLLDVSPFLTPHVRRHLFSRISLILDLHVPLLDIIGGVGFNVRSLRVRAPDRGDERLGSGEDPTMALVPITSTRQVESVPALDQILRNCQNLLHLEIETRVGTQDDQRGEETLDDCEGTALSSLRAALSGLSLRSFVLSIAHIHGALQILVDANFESPYPSAIATWSNLTKLDLWRVNLSLPTSFPDPTFALEELHLVQSTLGSARELEWLMGEAGGKRGERMKVLELRSIEFVAVPESSAPFLAVFSPAPSFAHTLERLTLELEFPLEAPIFSSLCRLKTLKIMGSGITPDMFLSLLPPPPVLNCPVPMTPSDTIVSLELSYSHQLFFDLLTASFAPPSFPALEMLWLIDLGASHRTTPWAMNSVAPLPLWRYTRSEWRRMEKVFLSRRRAMGGASKGGELRRHGPRRDWEGHEFGEGESDGSSASEEESDGDAPDGLFVPDDEAEVYVQLRRGESGEESDY